MLDYLAWRGDLALRADPLNDIDLLILAQLSYVNFDDVMPASGTAQSVTVGQASERLLGIDQHGGGVRQMRFFWERNKALLRALCRSDRLSGVEMAGYEVRTCEKEQTQFGAVAYILGDAVAVAFRGTDDSLVGWKEDLNLSFESPVPSQRAATAFVERIAGAFSQPLYICGHSKGGNLAVYAAANVPENVQSRILRVASFDGPGQDESVIESPGYARVHDRLNLFVPHFSVIGMLLEHEASYAVVASDERAIAQHNAFSWQVCGRSFVLEAAPNPQSVAANRILRAWIKGMSSADRRLFSDAIYAIMSASDADVLGDMLDNLPDTIRAMLRKMGELDSEEKSAVQRSISALMNAAKGSIQRSWKWGAHSGEQDKISNS